MNISPELLAPAGDWEALRAAVAGGADAVYFGVEMFNARLRAENFNRRDLPEIMDWLHARGVKGFLTLNVLIFTEELETVSELLVDCWTAEVDALIVQDLGLCLLARELVPDLVLHASTQMSVTSAAGVAQAAAAGCERVVMARELTLRDLERVQQQLKQRHLDVPLEVFVHGALCVAYSGQCLTSESLGQRSANRGECAQACRLPYQLIVDGEERDLGEQRYLLSPQDLAAWSLIPELARIGICSLKIEGRLKSAAYVAAVTDVYRRALDGVISEPDAISHQLELGFSRGLTTGWLEGIDHPALVHGRWSKKRGPCLGRLLSVLSRGWLKIEAETEPQCGQGVVLEVASSKGGPFQIPREVGGRIMKVVPLGDQCWRLMLGPGRIDTAGLCTGAPVWLTSDPQWQSTWSRRASRETPPLDHPLSLVISGRDGEPLVLALESPQTLDGQPLTVVSDRPLEPAKDHGLNRERLIAQLGRLGGTGWRLDQLRLDLPESLFLPIGELNRLRRALLQMMADAGIVPGNPETTQRQCFEAPNRDERRQLIRSCINRLPADTVDQTPRLTVLVRSLDQLNGLMELGDETPIQGVVADLEQPRDLKEAVAIARGCWSDGIWLTGPRVTRPDEGWTLEPLLRAKPDGFLVRNADQLERLSDQGPCRGDFSLNVANPLTLLWFLERWGLQRVTASCDLNLHQLLELSENVPSDRLEVVLHQHMPLFHMEHCLFCSLLSDGHDHTDCGRPCETHTVLLRDRSGIEHPLRADLGCRNTLFNGTAQTGVEAFPAMRARGLRHFRLDLLDEDAEATKRRVRLYGDAIQGRMPSAEVWRREQIEHRLGVTRGSLRADRAQGTTLISR